MRRGDLVEIVEATYDHERGDDAWIEQLLDRAAPHTNQGLGVHTFFYDTRVHPIRLWSIRDTPDCVMPAAMLKPALEGATREYVEQSWKRLHCATASEVPGWDAEPSRRQFFDAVGINDVLAINGYDSSGIGCFIGTPLPKKRVLRRAERALFERIATHLAAGFRLRLRARAEAILSTSGAILDASTNESKENGARTALRDAARDIERARGKMRKRDPEGAILSWRALVKAKWTLVDRFESDGKRLLVAMANAPTPPPVQKLTTAQLHVLGRIAEGQTTKLVAYELGLSDSTVRVLLMRAMRVLGAKSRAQAIAMYRKLATVYPTQ